jgi:hypothetical protein
MTGIDGNYVFLQLASRDTADSGMTNRIAFKCENVSISTSKNVLAFPVPGSGFLTGESESIGLDFGMATKSISLDGIITEQYVQKKFAPRAFGDEDGNLTSATDFSHGRNSDGGSSGYVNVKMTAHEVAQLVHSHVDSSIFQRHQNLNELGILIPSYVGVDYHYQGSCSISTHTNRKDCEDAGGTWTPIAASAGAADALQPTDGKLVPFEYGVRYNGASGNELDGKYTILNTSRYPAPYVSGGDVQGIRGFVRSFDTQFTDQPYVTFNMQFEIAVTGL